jgi:DNA-binding XRE family transcriptional regulator
MEASSFGEWLKRNRRSLGMTQAQLAGKVNCATITVRKIEAEERKPSIQIAEQLANILEIPDNERRIFLDFARGDWHMAPASGGGNYPWHSPATTNNLYVPAMLTAPVGRDHDVSSVKDLLASANIRRVTLVGPPGVGKTHLSKAIAHALLQQFPAGVFLSLSIP